MLLIVKMSQFLGHFVLFNNMQLHFDIVFRLVEKQERILEKQRLKQFQDQQELDYRFI